jgi:hypothetical protein
MLGRRASSPHLDKWTRSPSGGMNRPPSHAAHRCLPTDADLSPPNPTQADPNRNPKPWAPPLDAALFSAGPACRG